MSLRFLHDMLLMPREEGLGRDQVAPDDGPWVREGRDDRLDVFWYSVACCACPVMQVERRGGVLKDALHSLLSVSINCDTIRLILHRGVLWHTVNQYMLR